MGSPEQPVLDNSQFEEDAFDHVLGEVVTDDVPGNMQFQVRELIRNNEIFEEQLQSQPIQDEVDRQHEMGNEVAASHNANTIILHIAKNKNLIFVSGVGLTTLAAATTYYFLKKRES
jgi:hypothetical protein